MIQDPYNNQIWVFKLHDKSHPMTAVSQWIICPLRDKLQTCQYSVCTLMRESGAIITPSSGEMYVNAVAVIWEGIPRLCPVEEVSCRACLNKKLRWDVQL